MAEKRYQDLNAETKFSHTAGELLGGMARAGLVLDDAFDDTNGEGRLHELGISTMLAVRAHRGVAGRGRSRTGMRRFKPLAHEREPGLRTEGVGRMPG